MEVCFNELSQYPLCDTETACVQRVRKYAKVLKKLKLNYGISKIRYEHGLDDINLKDGYSLKDYCFCCNHKQDPSANLIVSMVKHPYIPEEKEEELGAYDYDDVKCVVGTNECDTLGLYCAYLYKGFAVSFSSAQEWTCDHVMLRLYSKGKHEDYSVINVALVAQLLDNKFCRWYARNGKIYLEKCAIAPNKKSFHVRDDHGKNVLKEFFNKIRKESYVTNAINSLPFNPGATEFIHKVYGDGKIELVLHWTDKGYGLVISTTAKNQVQAYYAANLLKDKYDK